MTKTEILEFIDRRIVERRKIIDNPNMATSIWHRAVGAWGELVSLKNEISDMGTKRDRRQNNE